MGHSAARSTNVILTSSSVRTGGTTAPAGDLNNLTDFTLDAAYSSICGYTERDLDTGASSAAAREDPAPRWCVRPIEAGGLRLSATSTTASASPGRSPRE